MSRTPASEELILGGEPRVDLLPPVVKSRQKSKALRRALGLGVVAAVVLVSAGVALASWQATIGQEQLAEAQQRTTGLLAEQTQYIEVRQIQDDVDLSIAARQVGASTEVDWKTYLEEIRAVLPSDVTIDTVDIKAASPLVLFEQPTAPLQAARIATIMLTMTSPSLPTVPEWLTELKSLPGYADGSPGSIKRSETGTYQVDLTLHINEGAYSNRFADSTTTEEK
ncbi:hypothetical protein E3T26_07365 [Cryobacterium sp. TMT1-21]|uniref:Fimbrial assembly protein n=1 Tax=Cryobacterium shii TaxID=1259235 RepID=A0AAQ2HFE9_9MICO|nr:MULTISPECIES: hypothetical protein [Cryobacterium]TFC47059.1 hypothetical protein E3O49_08700 [Cryobacterium shii]TFD15309.1 hypothetical protein E3T26_07365 [Cryobacterium sp. TMT1-21]